MGVQVLGRAVKFWSLSLTSEDASIMAAYGEPGCRELANFASQAVILKDVLKGCGWYCLIYILYIIYIYLRDIFTHSNITNLGIWRKSLAWEVVSTNTAAGGRCLCQLSPGNGGHHWRLAFVAARWYEWYQLLGCAHLGVVATLHAEIHEVTMIWYENEIDMIIDDVYGSEGCKEFMFIIEFIIVITTIIITTIFPPSAAFILFPVIVFHDQLNRNSKYMTFGGSQLNSRDLPALWPWTSEAVSAWRWMRRNPFTETEFPERVAPVQWIVLLNGWIWNWTWFRQSDMPLTFLNYTDIKMSSYAVKQWSSLLTQEVQFARAPGGHLSDAVDFPYCMLEADCWGFSCCGPWENLRIARENCKVFSETPFGCFQK